MNRLAILTGFCALVNPFAAADWPQWRGPQRSGYVDSGPLVSNLPTEGIKPLWQLESLDGGNSGGWGSPVASDGKVFVYAHTKAKNGDPGKKKYPWLPPDKRTGMTDEEYKEYEIKRRDEDERRAKAYSFMQRMICIDSDSGETVWDKSFPAKYTRFVQSGTPCVSDGNVFFLGPERTAFCLDAKSGDVVWQSRIPGEFRDEYFASSFVVHEGVALVCCGPIYALDAKDGSLLWKGDTNEDYGSHSSPAIHASKQPLAICNTSGGRTQGYRISDGKKLWELNTGTGQSSPLVVDDLLLTYGSSRKSGLVAFQLSADSAEKEPEELWRFRGAADSGSTPVVRGGYVFVQGEKRIAKVRLQDGETIWQTTLKISTPKYTSLIAAGDQVFYGWEGILAFDAEADDFQLVYDAEIDSERMLIKSDDLRRKLGLAKLASEEGGLAKSEKLWQDKAVKTGPLGCSTPAFTDGRLIVRLRDALVCYDLQQ